jgi:6-phosphogluconolactonase (cycloisomerase 2 family)
MYGWSWTAVSPDGRQVYSARANSDAFVMFDRDPATGAVVQTAGTAGCTVDQFGVPVAGCNNGGRATAFPSGIAISPDGRHAYVTGYNAGAIAVFDRDATTGALTQKAGVAGCIVDALSSDVPPCAHTGRALGAAHNVVVSPDGLNVYVSSDGFDSIAVFDRDTTTGELTQKAGSAGCVVNGPSADVAGCDNTGRGMSFARDLAVSSDGASVYVLGLISDSVAIFDRDPLTGALTQKAGAAGCIVNEPSTDIAQCDNNGRALDAPLGITVSPTDNTVYVAAALSSALVVLDRDASTGALTQKAGPAGCVVNGPSTDVATCDNTGRALDGVQAVAVSPDGASVYGAGFTSNAIVTFDRDSTGALAQRTGDAGCAVDEASTDVASCDNSARALAGPSSLAVSPDGKGVYASATVSDSLVAFRRDLVPVCQPLQTLANHNQVTAISLSCSDPNGDPLTLVIAGQPGHGGTGSINQAAAQVPYTPTSGYAGADSFSYGATANGEDSPAATVSLDVLPGQAPVCAPQARALGQGVAATLALSCAAGGDPFTFGIAGAPAHGMLGAIAQGTGLVEYTPGAGYSGDDSFSYTATSAFGTSAGAPFDLDVLPATSGPVGPPGAAGATGPPAFKLEVALFEARLRAPIGSRVRLRYVSTLSGNVQLSVLRKAKTVARVTGKALAGANAITWSGRVGKKAAAAGLYKLSLRTTNGDQTVTRSASLQLVPRRR